MNKLFLLSLILVGVLVIGSYVYLNLEKEDAMETEERNLFLEFITSNKEYIQSPGATKEGVDERWNSYLNKQGENLNE